MLPLEASTLFGQLPATRPGQFKSATRKLGLVTGGDLFRAREPGDGVGVVE